MYPKKKRVTFLRMNLGKRYKRELGMCLISTVSGFAHTLLLTLVPEVDICSMAVYLPSISYSSSAFPSEDMDFSNSVYLV